MTVLARGINSSNILLFLAYEREKYRDLILSENEIVAGPDLETSYDDGRLKTLKTPMGGGDLSEVLRQIPEEQQPELIVVRADAARRIAPTGITETAITTVMIAGDTQHLETPIQYLTNYVKEERFDFIITDHKRHHLHWFQKAGYSKDQLAFIPALMIKPNEPAAGHPQEGVLFLGSVNQQFHPYRFNLLKQLQGECPGLTVKSGTREEGLELIRNNLINLNISLNGDLNLRVFEVLSAGGFLLTDRLTAESGLSLCFTEGEEYEAFSGYEELKSKIEYYLAHPERALAIARAGAERFWAQHNPAIKIRQFWNFVSGTPEEETKRISYDLRFDEQDDIDYGELAKVYEFVQENHRLKERVILFFHRDIPDSVVHIFSDLPRLQILREMESYQFADLIFLPASFDPAAVRTAAVSECVVIIPLGGEVPLSIEGFERNAVCPLFFERTSDPVSLAEELIDGNDLNGGLHILKELIAHERYSGRLYWNFSRIAKLTGDLSGEERLLQQAFVEDSNFTNTLLSQTEMLLRQNRTVEAIAPLKHLVALEPENCRYSVALAELLVGNSEFDEAIDLYKKVEKIDASVIPETVDMEALLRMSGRPVPRSRIKNKRILVITNIFPPQELGGYGRTMLDFSTLLAERGHEVRVLTSDTSYLGEITEEEPHIARELELFGRWKDGVAESFPDEEALPISIRDGEIAVKHIEDFQPDLVLLGNVDFIGWHIIQEVEKREIPLIHRLGNKSPGYDPRFIPDHNYYRLATCSGWLRDEIWRNGYRLPKIDVVYPSGKVHHYFRRDLPELGDALHIAFAGIVQQYKGPQILLKALFILREQGIPFTATFAGTTTNENFYNSLVSLVESAGMSDRIRFVGFLDRDQLRDMFWEHTVYVQPSIFEEPFGISHVEAMASGVVTVTSGTGGSKEIVTDGISGLHFRSEDAVSLAEQLRYLYENPTEMDRLRRAGQEKVMKRFDNVRSVDRLEEIFAELLYEKKMRKNLH